MMRPAKSLKAGVKVGQSGAEKRHAGGVENY